MDSVFETKDMIDGAAEYFRTEGLADLVAGGQPSETNGNAAIAPDVGDLVRLHQMIRKRRAFTVLEFGIGYSTLIIADALAKNAEDFASSDVDAELLPADAFRVFSIDASEAWLKTAMARIPNKMKNRVVANHSPVHTGTFNGQLCHFYDRLPNVVPD